MSKKPEPEIFKVPKIYYDSFKGGFWTCLPDGTYQQLDTAKVKLLMRRAGLYSGKNDDGSLNAVEMRLTDAILFNSVHYAGPLAGHKTGIFETSGGKRVLVTSQCNVWTRPKSKETHCPFILGFLTELFGEVQVIHVLAWLKLSIASLMRGDFRPGQACVICGPVESGKSFFHVIVTELLGGRAAKPFAWMSGDTTFNEDIAQAESLVIEDEQGSTDIRSRVNFGTKIKQITVNETFHIHGKGKIGEMLKTFKRTHMTLNEGPNALMVLPPNDSDVMEKMNLYKGRRVEKALVDDRLENLRRLTKELPNFVNYLSKMRIPEELGGNRRFGIMSYHHPDIMEALGATLPETRLMDLIDQIIFDVKVVDEETPKDSQPTVIIKPFKGSATELEKRLRSSAFSFEVDKLLHFPGACGWYLQKLALKSDRIISKKSQGKKYWIINPERSSQ